MYRKLRVCIASKENRQFNEKGDTVVLRAMILTGTNVLFVSYTLTNFKAPMIHKQLSVLKRTRKLQFDSINDLPLILDISKLIGTNELGKSLFSCCQSPQDLYAKVWE